MILSKLSAYTAKKFRLFSKSLKLLEPTPQ